MVYWIGVKAGVHTSVQIGSMLYRKCYTETQLLVNVKVKDNLNFSKFQEYNNFLKRYVDFKQ